MLVPIQSREVSDSDGIGEADGSLMLPVVLRPAPGEGISARLGPPQVVKVQQGAGGQGCQGGAGI